MTSSIPANEYVTDTMAVVLHLENRRSSPTVRQLFEAADNGKTTIHIPAIVFAEIFYLSVKGRIGLALADVKRHMARHNAYREAFLSLEVVENALKGYRRSKASRSSDRFYRKSKKLGLITSDPTI